MRAGVYDDDEDDDDDDNEDGREKRLSCGHEVDRIVK